MHAVINLMSPPPAWLAIFSAPFIGSFLGVLILRLPVGRPVVAARSACDKCGHPLAPVDLIPLVSYALCKGRCRYCGDMIAPFMPAIEIAATAIAACSAAWVPGDQVWPTCILGWTLLTTGWIDLRTMILPDILTLPLLLAGLLATAILNPDDLADHAMAAATGYLLLVTVAWTYRKLRRREGLGRGDAKLFAALGAWLGINDLPFVLLFASCAGLIAAAVGALAGKRLTATTAIPFGPFLALAGWLCWLYAGGLPPG